MKTLKFMPHLVDKILSGEKKITWRLFDDKSLSSGDELELVNKETGLPFAHARITEVRTKTLGEITDDDYEGYERFPSKDEMYATYRRYYGDRVGEWTEVKIVRFEVTEKL